MASFKDKDTDILFSNVGLGTALGGKYYNGNNGNFSDAAIDGVETFVNAVEIDWNGASICNQTVNTTGQLLNIINDLNNKVNLLTLQVGAEPNQIELTGPTNNAYHSYYAGVGYTLYGSNAQLNVNAKLTYIYDGKEYDSFLNKYVGWRLQTINHITHDSYFTFDGTTLSGNNNTIGLNMTGNDLTYLQDTLGIDTFTFEAYSVSNPDINGSINIQIADGKVGEFTADITDIKGGEGYSSSNSLFYSYGVIKVSNIETNSFYPTVNISVGNTYINGNNNAYIKLVEPQYVQGGYIHTDFIVNHVNLSGKSDKTIYCYTCLDNYPDSDMTVPITISLLNKNTYCMSTITKNVSFYKNGTPAPSNGPSDTPGSDITDPDGG